MTSNVVNQSVVDGHSKAPDLSCLENVKCCVCDVLDAVPLAVGEDFEYHTCSDQFLAMRCRRCGLVFLNPRPCVQDLEVIYPANYHAYDFSEEKFGFVHRVRTGLEARRLRKLCEGLPPAARILDVGCGDGYHLAILRDFCDTGWHFEGVDANPLAVEKAVRRGLTVHHGRLEDLQLDSSSYDLVLLIATIEHVENPFCLLEEVHRLLKSRGRAVIVTDNTDTLDFRFWGRYWGGYHFPRHWNLFNKDALSRLARKCRFTVHKVETLLSPVNWVYSFHNWMVDYNAPKSLLKQFSLKGAPVLALFTVWDFLFQLAGSGALLRFTLKKDAL